MKTPVRYIAKCKACGVHTSELVTPEVFRAVQMHDGWPQTNAAPEGTRFCIVAGSFCLRCKACDKPKLASPVRGKFSAKHTCGAKCLSATGTSCECSCAGKNHGAGHG